MQAFHNESEKVKFAIESIKKMMAYYQNKENITVEGMKDISDMADATAAAAKLSPDAATAAVFTELSEKLLELHRESSG